MKGTLFCLLITITTFPSLVLSETPSAIKLKTKKEQMSSYSSITPSSKIKTGHAVAIINSNSADLLEILTDYSEYNKFLPFITSSRFLSSSGDLHRFSVKAEILHGTVSIAAILQSRVKKSDKSVNISLIKGDLKELSISFRAERLTDKTSVLFLSFLVDPDLWFVRDKTISRYNQVNARRIVRALRDYIGEKQT